MATSHFDASGRLVTQAKWLELARRASATPAAEPLSVRRSGSSGSASSGGTVPWYGPTNDTAVLCCRNHCQIRYRQVQSPSRPCGIESLTTMTRSTWSACWRSAAAGSMADGKASDRESKGKQQLMMKRKGEDGTGQRQWSSALWVGLWQKRRELPPVGKTRGEAGVSPTMRVRVQDLRELTQHALPSLTNLTPKINIPCDGRSLRYSLITKLIITELTANSQPFQTPSHPRKGPCIMQATCRREEKGKENSRSLITTTPHLAGGSIPTLTLRSVLHVEF